MKISKKDNVVPSLQMQTYGQLVKLNKGQKGLLILITKKVTSKCSLTWNDIVDCYCKHVRSKYTGGYYSNNRYKYEDLDIKKEYGSLSVCWTYTLRSLIKQWFLTTIGILVIKNQLAVIPLIEIDN